MCKLSDFFYGISLYLIIETTNKTNMINFSRLKTKKLQWQGRGIKIKEEI